MTLTGAGSSDPDGDGLTYAWTQTAGPAMTLSAANVVSPTFTAPGSATTLTFALVVRDQALASPADTVTITVTPANRAPVADAGPDQSVPTGSTVTLTGAGSSDPDGDGLTYAWTQTAGPAMTLSAANVVSPTFTAPGSATTLTFALVVRDQALASPADTVTITVTPANRAPVADAGPDQSVSTGSTVTLTGAGSSDPDGDGLTYAWTQTAGPAMTLSAANVVSPTFTAPGSATTLTFALVVRDQALASPADTVTITVQMPGPSSLTATASASGVLLDWADAVDPNVGGFNVYRSASAGGPFSAVNGKVVTTSAWDDTLAPAGQSFYRVTSVTIGGTESVPSTVSATMTKVNRIANPSFELDANADSRPDSWTSSARFLRSAEAAHSGAFGGRHRATTNANYSITQTVTGLAAGASYDLAGWVTIPATRDTFTMTVRIVWQNSKKSVISTQLVQAFSAQTSGWVKIGGSFVAPAGSTRAVVEMVVTSLSATVDVDDFALR